MEEEENKPLQQGHSSSNDFISCPHKPFLASFIPCQYRSPVSGPECIEFEWKGGFCFLVNEAKLEINDDFLPPLTVQNKLWDDYSSPWDLKQTLELLSYRLPQQWILVKSYKLNLYLMISVHRYVQHVFHKGLHCLLGLHSFSGFWCSAPLRWGEKQIGLFAFTT